MPILNASRVRIQVLLHTNNIYQFLRWFVIYGELSASFQQGSLQFVFFNREHCGVGAGSIWRSGCWCHGNLLKRYNGAVRDYEAPMYCGNSIFTALFSSQNSKINWENYRAYTKYICTFLKTQNIHNWEYSLI